MRTAIQPDLNSKTLCSIKRYTYLREKEARLFDKKFYQKLFAVLVSMSTILIFPESPRELENICKSHNSSNSCIVW